MIETRPFKHRTTIYQICVLKKAGPYLSAPNGQRASAAMGSWVLMGLHLASFWYINIDVGIIFGG